MTASTTTETGARGRRRAAPLRRGTAQARIAGAQLAATGRRLVARGAPAGRAVVARVSPVVRTVSALGWVVLVSGVLALTLVLVFGWAEFAFLGATLLAALVLAVGFVIGRSTYAVGVELTPRRVVAGDRAYGRLTVRNSGQRPVLPTRLELPVGEGVAGFTVPRLVPGAEVEELFAVPTARRALILAGPAISVRGDQLGLLRRTTRWTDQVELFVHPRTVRLAATARGLVRDLEGQTTKVITDSDLAFHALRTYEAGDDIRNVHWRTSARTGQLMVRQYQETRRSQLLLALDAERARFASDDEFELAVSVFASIGCHVIREDTGIDALWQGGGLRVSTPTAFLDDSCRLQPSGSGAGVREFLRQATLRMGAPSLAVTVVGSQATPAELRAAAALWTSDTETITVRVDETAEPRVARLGRTILIVLGRLDELPALLKRAGR
ncbi:DUF58 domain-containing protein [Leifsonia shinshuensis]|uniref:DUF58 domain-containing protein n=1 Tax=Leifsonia shinshuensis TaxID=150026 RepID=A0A7G6Y7R4_9MICO|nr:DUF58 domain-containing protein [Leifsonia shinshuensis]QNE34529.1 DUF58 domain-containing protein [Leifsonia shinshuensis]